LNLFSKHSQVLFEKDLVSMDNVTCFTDIVPVASTFTVQIHVQPSELDPSQSIEKKIVAKFDQCIWKNGHKEIVDRILDLNCTGVSADTLLATVVVHAMLIKPLTGMVIRVGPLCNWKPKTPTLQQLMNHKYHKQNMKIYTKLNPNTPKAQFLDKNLKFKLIVVSAVYFNSALDVETIIDEVSS